MRTEVGTAGWLAIVFSWLIAFASFDLPAHVTPTDYYTVLHFSIPLSVLWLLVVLTIIYRLGRKSLWTLVGVLPGLFWPVYVIAWGIPSCYWKHACE